MMHNRYASAARRLMVAAATVASVAVGMAACSDVSGILDVPPPAGVQTGSSLENRSGAEAAFFGAKSEFFYGVGGNRQLLMMSGLFTDELSWAYFYSGSGQANVDARRTAAFAGYSEDATNPLSTLLGARASLLLVAPRLLAYEPEGERRRAGEAYALVGYIELLIAEHYCAGITLDQAKEGGGISYGMPLTTDSLLAIAQTHFDSALTHAYGDPAVRALASIGLARTRLNRGQYTQAAAAVSAVPTSFVYSLESPTSFIGYGPNLYAAGNSYSFSCSNFATSDNEGGNGLNFVSAHDPRLVTDTLSGRTCDARSGVSGAGPWYYPVKFGKPSTLIPFATGAEARLIEAEAALKADQPVVWANTLNTLRTDAPSTYLHLTSAMPALTADSTTDANATTRVDVMFRERAFWLFGMGNRLGDLRRLVGQYGRSANTVFPTGTFVNGNTLTPPITTYGTDVSLTLPTPAGGKVTTNPNYKGCLASS